MSESKSPFRQRLEGAVAAKHSRMNPFTENRFRVNRLEKDSSNQLPWWRDVSLGRDWKRAVSGLGALP